MPRKAKETKKAAPVVPACRFCGTEGIGDVKICPHCNNSGIAKS